MVCSNRRLLAGLLVVIAVVATWVPRLIDRTLSRITEEELEVIYVGQQCNTQQTPTSCCLFSAFNSCQNQIGSGTCQNGTVILGNCIATSAGLPACPQNSGTPAPTCAFALLMVGTDTCTLNGKKNPNGTCQYAYQNPQNANTKIQVCNCNPTFSICQAGKQVASPCPTK